MWSNDKFSFNLDVSTIWKLFHVDFVSCVKCEPFYVSIRIGVKST